MYKLFIWLFVKYAQQAGVIFALFSIVTLHIFGISTRIRGMFNLVDLSLVSVWVFWLLIFISLSALFARYAMVSAINFPRTMIGLRIWISDRERMGVFRGYARFRRSIFVRTLSRFYIHIYIILFFTFFIDFYLKFDGIWLHRSFVLLVMAGVLFIILVRPKDWIVVRSAFSKKNVSEGQLEKSISRILPIFVIVASLAAVFSGQLRAERLKSERIVSITLNNGDVIERVAIFGKSSSIFILADPATDSIFAIPEMDITRID